MIYYKASHVFTGKELLANQALLVENGKIVAIVQDTNQYTHAQTIDFGQCILAPAFIDLQIYGGNNNLFATQTTVETLQKTYEEVNKSGTAYFQITLPTVSPNHMFEAINACKAYKAHGGKGLIGLHLEGPYINPEKKGAHLEAYIHKPTLSELVALLKEGKGIITCLTFAPECMDVDCLEFLLENNIQLSLGHSNATFEQAKTAINKGVKQVTHLFNAMSQLQSRAAGMVGACYDSDVYASIVADGIHVDFHSLALSKKIMGDRLYYISDAMTTSHAGEYVFMRATDYYTNTQGILAGSALTMLQAVKNGVKQAGISIEESLRMASLYPARVARIDEHAGKLEKGYPANFVVLDTDLELRTSVIHY